MPEINPVRLHSPAPHLSGPVRALPWAGEALCAQTDPDLWFPEEPTSSYTTVDGTREATAKSICKRCPCLVECREYAMADPRLDGTWGALTSRERDDLRRRQARGTA